VNDDDDDGDGARRSKKARGAGAIDAARWRATREESRGGGGARHDA
jgi:hypothetical protein